MTPAPVLPLPLVVYEKVIAASSTHAPILAGTKTVPASHSPAPSHQHPSYTQLTDQQSINIHPSARLTVVEQSSLPPHHGILEWTARVTNLELASPFSSSSVKFLKILGNSASAPIISEVIMHSSIAPPVVALTALINKISLCKNLYTLTMLLLRIRD